MYPRLVYTSSVSFVLSEASCECLNTGLDTDLGVIETVLWNRKQDQHTVITDRFKELINKRPWFADMVPDVNLA